MSLPHPSPSHTEIKNGLAKLGSNKLLIKSTLIGGEGAEDNWRKRAQCPHQILSRVRAFVYSNGLSLLTDHNSVCDQKCVKFHKKTRLKMSVKDCTNYYTGVLNFVK